MDENLNNVDELIDALSDTIACGAFDAFKLAIQDYEIAIPVETAHAFEAWFWGAPAGCVEFLKWYLESLPIIDSYAGTEKEDCIKILEQAIYSFGSPELFAKFFDIFPYEISRKDIPFTQLALKAAKESPAHFGVMVNKRKQYYPNSKDVEQLKSQLIVLLEFQHNRIQRMNSGIDKDKFLFEINNMEESLANIK